MAENKASASATSGVEKLLSVSDVSKKAEPKKQDSSKTSSKSSGKSSGSTAKSTSSKPKLAESVLKPEEICRIVDLGLGRGVNATVPSPWLHKTSFQVREVTLDNIIGTEEGGILQGYVDEVVSVEEIQSLMSSSVPVSDQVTVGVDAELSRTYSTSRRSMGRKLITRSISFKPDFDPPKVHHIAAQSLVTADPADLADPALSPSKDVSTAESDEKSQATPCNQDDTKNLPNFEQRLALWILESLVNEEIQTLQEFSPDEDPIVVLANFIFEWPADKRNALARLLKRKCRDFVNNFSVTHYVSSIDLGASQYEVLTEQQYQEQLGVKNKLEILSIISNSTEQKRSSLRRNKSSRTTEIGRFDGNTVHRGTTDEAVVSVEFKPISALIKVKILQSALQKAIKDYIDDQEFSRAGPFIISCNDESIFLKVTSNFEVVGTRKIEDSSDFFISYNEDGRSAYEFSINHMSVSPLVEREVKPVSRYLYAPVSIQGKNRGPLTLKLDARNKDTIMTLHSRRVGNFEPVDTKHWLSSRDIFYISCKQRVVGRDSYLCVKRMPSHYNRPDEFVTYCVPSIKKHDESREHYMLFRLLRASKREYVDKKEKDDSESEPLGVQTTLRRSSKTGSATSGSGTHLFGFRLPFVGRATTENTSGKENIELAEVEGETEM